MWCLILPLAEIKQKIRFRPSNNNTDKSVTYAINGFSFRKQKKIANPNIFYPNFTSKSTEINNNNNTKSNLIQAITTCNLNLCPKPQILTVKNTQ
jgi:hypothetical protein